jgi:hypothetical protein
MTPRWLIALLVASAVTGCAGSASSGSTSGQSKSISKATFKGTWPFTVNHGVVGCTDGKVTFTAPDGTVYGINGTALDAGYADAKPIWRKDPTGLAPNVSIGDVQEVGLKLCGQQ